MAYDLPTVEQFLDRFPTFEGEDEYLIAALIGEAAEQVDDSWIERDYPRAIMYLVAHTLVAEDNAGATGGSSSGTGSSGIASESFGGISVSYTKNASESMSKSLEGLDSTEYGRHYLALRNKNFPGVSVV